MLEDNGTCKTLCTVDNVTGSDAWFINNRIREHFLVNWLMDGLPAAEMKMDLRNGEVFYDMGFNLGNDEDYTPTPAFNNHYEIVLRSAFPSLIVGSR